MEGQLGRTRKVSPERGCASDSDGILEGRETEVTPKAKGFRYFFFDLDFCFR